MKTTKDLEILNMHRPDVKIQTPYTKTSGKSTLYTGLYSPLRRTMYK